MSVDLPNLFLARHGDTAWTDSHQHTGRTDIPLNASGEEHARKLGECLREFFFVRVFTSPLQRASKTCELAGFGAVAEVDEDLLEWDYGRWEGKLTSEILKNQPDWELFRDGCPGGESPQDVAARADHFIAQVHGMVGDVLAFSSGHIIRMIAARWHGMSPAAGRVFFCRPASMGVLGFEHDRRDQPVIRLWNYVSEPREGSACTR
jgi:probable phosphoglycerate mutase